MKILLVEDTRAVAAVMAARLASFGHDVIVAENGQVAVARFTEAAPDLVLMDIEMPVMNGFEATNRIRAVEARQQWAWTPILFLTASDTEDNLITAIEAGGDDFIPKATSEAVLHAKMKAMGRIAALRQSLASANRKLADQAKLDGLTGLYNRRQMDALTDLAWAEAVATGGPFGLLMLDVDNFKRYNDHYGHQAGDECLCAVARMLQAAVADGNLQGLCHGAFPARYGGEEFAVVMPDADTAALDRMASNIVEAVRGGALPHEKNDGLGVVTVSVGGAHQAAAQGRLVDLFRAADARLYRAKQAGRNRAVLAG